MPKYLSSDRDPLYKFHQWQANLRILEVIEIKSVPCIPLSRPFVERLSGTIRRECLDHTLLAKSDVRVIEGDATHMPFGNSEFSSAASFTMLHHVPSSELQDQVLREVCRVLKPGGFFVGSDSLQNWWMRTIHIHIAD